MPKKAKSVVEKARPNESALNWKYKIGNTLYGMDIVSLRNDYQRFIEMTDEQFAENLVQAAHYAVFVSFYKNLTPLQSIGDEGVVHQLIHLLHFKPTKKSNFDGLYSTIFPKARKNFKNLLAIDLPENA
jgi:hypothetical protein